MKSLLTTLMFVLALTMGPMLTGCEVEQTREGEMPEVDIDAEAGQLPQYDVDPAEVEIGTEEKTIEVPDVDIGTEEREITVPDIDVQMPDEEPEGLEEDLQE